MKSIFGISGFVFAIIAATVIFGFPFPVQAQAFAGGQFKLSESVHWGRAVLPTGKYMYSVESGAGATLVRVQQIGGGFTGLFLPQTFSEAGNSGSGGIVLSRVGQEMFVTSLQLENGGLALNFSASNSEIGIPDVNSVEGPAKSVSQNSIHEFFTIVNHGSEKVSDIEAERVYLAACAAVEHEFSRPASIRPRLTVRLGAGQNLLHYPTREIRLTKWDKYKFADGVLELALRDMVTHDDKIRLSNLAVTQAGGTVSVCELKNCTN